VPVTVTRIAHSTVLIDFDGHRVLTDPWFSERFGYYHGEPYGIALADLPRIVRLRRSRRRRSRKPETCPGASSVASRGFGAVATPDATMPRTANDAASSATSHFGFGDEGRCNLMIPVAAPIFCSHRCSHQNGIPWTQWTSLEYLESGNQGLNSIAA
jgi:hypothetical protein